MTDIQEPYQLPEGWTWVTISDVTLKVTDGSHNPPKKESQGIPMISARNINNNKIDFAEVRYISQEAFIEESKRTNIEGGDVLLTIVASIGRSAIVPKNINFPFTLQRSVALLKPALISSEYLMYVTQSPFFQKILSKEAKGTAQKGVYLKTLNKLLFPLCSLNHQRTIVQKIEELFSELDKSTEGLEKTRRQLDVYKFILLNDAFEGKLTAEWRKVNSANSAINELELIKKMRIEGENLIEIKKKNLSADFSFKKHPTISGWAIAKLDKLVTISARLGWKGLKKDEYTESGPLFLSVHSLNYGKTVNFSQVNHISIERYEESPEIILQENDVILCKDGAGIGKVGIIKQLPAPATVNSSLLIVRGNEVFHPDFLYYLFLGPKLQRIVMERVSGSAIPHLFQRDIKEFMLDVPPFEEQKQIVTEIERRLTLVEHLEDNTINTLRQIEALRLSILKRAMSGKLVKNEDPTESTKEFLSRIKKEKEAFTIRQKDEIKNRLPKVKTMEKDLSIEEILQQSENPISAKDVWQQSKHKNDIEEFYRELKLLGSMIKEIKNETESLLTLSK